MMQRDFLSQFSTTTSLLVIWRIFNLERKEIVCYDILYNYYFLWTLFVLLNWQVTKLTKPSVNFINVLHAHFLYKSLFGSFFLVTFLGKKDFHMKNAPVKCWWNWYLGGKNAVIIAFSALVIKSCFKISCKHKFEISWLIFFPFAACQN